MGLAVEEQCVGDVGKTPNNGFRRTLGLAVEEQCVGEMGRTSEKMLAGTYGFG
jgi:hypothetical protein